MRNPPILRLISCGRILPIGFIALLFAAIVGGTTFAADADFNLRLVEGLVCPADSTLTSRLGAYEEVDDFPSASNPLGSSSSGRAFFVYCVEGDEVVRSGNGLLVMTLATMLGGYFLACFLPLLITSGIALTFVRRAMNKRRGVTE